MSHFPDSAGSKSLDQREHQTDASAKRVVSYYQDDNGDWTQLTPDLTAGTDYDYLDVQQTDVDVETYVFKLGGASGTTVRTIVVTYTDSSKETIANVSWS